MRGPKRLVSRETRTKSCIIIFKYHLCTNNIICAQICWYKRVSVYECNFDCHQGLRAQKQIRKLGDLQQLAHYFGRQLLSHLQRPDQLVLTCANISTKHAWKTFVKTTMGCHSLRNFYWVPQRHVRDTAHLGSLSNRQQVLAGKNRRIYILRVDVA